MLLVHIKYHVQKFTLYIKIVWTIINLIIATEIKCRIVISSNFGT